MEIIISGDGMMDDGLILIRYLMIGRLEMTTHGEEMEQQLLHEPGEVLVLLTKFSCNDHVK
jgi:hypothetical protein